MTRLSDSCQLFVVPVFAVFIYFLYIHVLFFIFMDIIISQQTCSKCARTIPIADFFGWVAGWEGGWLFGKKRGSWLAGWWLAGGKKRGGWLGALVGKKRGG